MSSTVPMEPLKQKIKISLYKKKNKPLFQDPVFNYSNAPA